MFLMHDVAGGADGRPDGLNTHSDMLQNDSGRILL